MNQEVLQVITGIATGAGAVGGYAINAACIRRADSNKDSIVDNLKPIDPEEASTTKIERSTIKRFGNFLIRKVAPAGVAAVALGLAPPAWLNSSPPTSTQEPTLQTVYDLSGQTLYDGAFAREQTINKDFIGNQKMRVNVTLARGGSFEDGSLTPSNIANFSKYSPLGRTGSSLPNAFTAALGSSVNSAIPTQSNVIGANKNEAAGAVLVVTDDNPIGPVSSVVSAAKEDNARVYVANVGDQTDLNAKDLQTIAQETGGKYWNAESHVAEVANKIISYINPSAKLPDNNNNDGQNLLKGLDIIDGLAFVGLVINSAEVEFSSNKVKKGE